MFQRSRDRNSMIKQFLASSSDMEMRSLATSYGIQKKLKIVRSRDVMFHEHSTMEENVRNIKLTFEGVVDLTLGRISS